MAENPKQAVTKVLTQPKVVVVKPVKKTAKPLVEKKEVTPSKKDEKPVKATAPKSPKPSKPAKVKTVRETITMPAADYDLLMQIKKRCQQDGLKIKKGELLCVGLGLLAKLTPASLAKALQKS
jgi:hypothetical protein